MNVFHHLSNKVIHVSFITEIEIQSKKNQLREDRKLVKGFLNDCIIIDINSSIKEAAIKLRHQKSTKLPDAIIASTAIFMRHPLVTSDDVFSNISDLNVLFFNHSFMKYIALIFTLIFILFAGWQYNDPDPMLWIPIYLIAAYATFRTFQGKTNPEMLLVLIVISFAGGMNSWNMMTAWEGFFSEGGGLSMKSNNQELAREACGLWICTVSFMVCWEIDRFTKSASSYQ